MIYVDNKEIKMTPEQEGELKAYMAASDGYRAAVEKIKKG
jgi:hypothetical protein